MNNLRFIMSEIAFGVQWYCYVCLFFKSFVAKENKGSEFDSLKEILPSVV